MMCDVHNPNYTLHIQYKKERKINGWGGKFDKIRFDSKEELLNYISGKCAYDYLDNCVQTSDNEILLYAEDENGRVVWGVRKEE